MVAVWVSGTGREKDGHGLALLNTTVEVVSVEQGKARVDVSYAPRFFSGAELWPGETASLA